MNEKATEDWLNQDETVRALATFLVARGDAGADDDDLDAMLGEVRRLKVSHGLWQLFAAGRLAFDLDDAGDLRFYVASDEQRSEIARRVEGAIARREAGVR